MLLEEVGALNGTTVNGHRLTPGKPTVLSSGDKLGLGMVSLIFKSAPDASGKAAGTGS